MANLNNGGLTRVLSYIKSWVSGLLSNKSDTNHSHTWNDIASKPSFANVATSGSYNDLSNKPTIPTVNNATLTIQKNGTTVNSFTANASSNVTANITVPTKTSELTNDSGYLSGTVGIASGGTGATTSTRAVANLTNDNLGTSAEYFLTITTGWNRVGYSHVADAKSVLGVPTNTNQLTNGAGFITSSGSCNYANSAGHAATAAKLIGDDTRNNNYTPANYINSGQQATIRSEFKQRSTLGAPGDSTYGTSVTITPWRDNSGGRPVQFYLSDSGYTSAIRFATGDSSWSSWYQLNTEYLTKLNGYRIYVG